MNYDVKKKINLVSRIAIVAMLIMVAYAPKLWFGTKSFPVIPRFDFIPLPNEIFTYVFSIGLIGLLVLFFIKPKKIIGISIVFLYIYLALVDQNRLQPYFYQSILTVFIVSYLRKNRKHSIIVLHALMLIFIATYFWSGILKLNDNFYPIWTSAFNKHFDYLPTWFNYYFIRAIPFIEAIIGVFLLFNKTRKLGVIAVVTMHLGITILLILFGYGYNVIPWNLQNILSVIILFWSFKSTFTMDILTQFFNYKKAVVLFITFLLPFTNLFGFWDHLLSFSFFTANLNYYYVELNEEKLIPHLPENIKYYVFDYDGKKIINLNDWAGTENGVLFYPEDRVAYKAEKYLKSFAENPNDTDLIKLVEYHQQK